MQIFLVVATAMVALLGSLFVYFDGHQGAILVEPEPYVEFLGGGTALHMALLSRVNHLRHVQGLRLSRWSPELYRRSLLLTLPAAFGVDLELLDNYAITRWPSLDIDAAFWAWEHAGKAPFFGPGLLYGAVSILRIGDVVYYVFLGDEE